MRISKNIAAKSLPYYTQQQTDTPAAEIVDKTKTAINAASHAVQLPPDQLVPDPIIAKEFYTTLMGIYRWTHDANLGFPPPIKIRNRNFRSRRAIEEFKAKMMRAAITRREVA
ncbi:hypothetical protein [Bradyrhizobium sp. AUGA SZCCT0042]|uniref:hypothetical protein n=1 Tax=Bradyrhizobium sp. AUGA SZCCT0042 TaxID=2807651 RepID=UPI001BA775CD|nr:hypothetical protein [Bradyrhizobium sp. AUGA SZCCT0042]MBR1296658.1 hypothetical protein [Bradyrhizobium sp. AUGA SZCCT0042]